MEKILKRDGKIVEFNSEKITSAIQKAAETTNEFDIQTARKLTRQVLEITKKLVEEKKDKLRIPSVEEIQDIVETVLLSSEYKKTAKNYILYREQHSRLRDFIQNANVDMVDDYLKKLDWQVRENSNMTYSIQGLNNYLASNLSKSYWLNKIYSKKVKEAHINGDIHIHDLNIVAGYCVGAIAWVGI